jgi:hypothetical protein
MVSAHLQKVLSIKPGVFLIMYKNIAHNLYTPLNSSMYAWQEGKLNILFFLISHIQLIYPIAQFYIYITNYVCVFSRSNICFHWFGIVTLDATVLVYYYMYAMQLLIRKVVSQKSRLYIKQLSVIYTVLSRPCERKI